MEVKTNKHYFKDIFFYRKELLTLKNMALAKRLGRVTEYDYGIYYFMYKQSYK